ncbi:MAG: efflux RND transporter periplasmic adaptor subunit [Planctomycetota bacterium]
MQSPQTSQTDADNDTPLAYTLSHRIPIHGGDMATQKTAPKNKSWLARALPLMLGVVLIALAAGTVAALVATKPEPPKEEIHLAPLSVRTLEATPVPIARQWEAYGSASAPVSSDIAALVPGPIVSRPDHINPGTWVSAGELIAQIDPAEYEQRLTRAQQQAASIQAQLTSLTIEKESSQVSLSLAEEAVTYTRNELERLRDAASRGVATQNEIERLLRELTSVEREAQTIRERLTTVPSRRTQLEAELAARQADIELAQLDLDRTRIVAPFEGALQDVSVQVGERVNVNQVAARIVDLRRIEVALRLPVSAVISLTLGDSVNLRADNPSGQLWTATIERIAPETDAATRTATAFVVYEQPADAWQDNLLLPGQFVTATISAGDPQPRIVLPRAAVIADRVFTLNESSTSQPRTVTIAHHHEGRITELIPGNTQWVVLESGIAPGETVIISNLEDLKAGLPVTADNPGNDQ